MAAARWRDAEYFPSPRPVGVVVPACLLQSVADTISMH